MTEVVKIDLQTVGLPDLRKAADEILRLGNVSSKTTGRIKPLGAMILRLNNEQKKLDATRKSLIANQGRLGITTTQINRALKEQERISLQRLNTDEQSLRLAKKKERDRKLEIKDEQRLTALYAPKTMAAREYDRVVKEIIKAHTKGYITADDFAESLSRVETEFKQFTAGAATGGNQFAKFNVEAYRAMQSTKRFASVGLQQAGYQIGDFIVQVQSGQSALVALGQQGSQLAGIFGPKGAIFGAVLAGVTALAMIFKESANAAKTSAEDMKTAFSDMGSFFSDVGIDIEMSFDKAFANIERRYGKFVAAIAKDRIQAVKDALQTGAEGAEDAAKPSFLDQLGVALGAGMMAQVPGGVTIIKEEKQRIAAAHAVNREANALVETFKKQVQELNSMEEISKAVLETFIALGEDKKFEEAQKAFKQQMTDLGLDDVIREFEKTKFERDIAFYERAYDFEEGLLRQRQANQAQISDNAIALAVEIYLKEQELAEINAEIAQRRELENMRIQEEYIKKGQEAQRKRDKLRHEINLKYIALEAEQQVKLGINPYAINMGSISESANIYKDRKKAETKAAANAAKAAANAGKLEAKRAEQLEQYLTKLRNEAKLSNDLIGVSKQRAEIEKELLKLKLKYGDLITPQVEQEITNQMKLRDAAKQASLTITEEINQQAQLFEFAAKSYGDFLYDVLAGNESTAKSFENMSKKIVAHLFDVLVMQQLIGSVGTADKAGTGLLGLFTFEGGGYTGRGPRSGGMDGKGGFMAMLHPNETVIDHTKGQGGGVVVNQNFNIAANGDETVRQIVANEAPKIANMATAAVLDGRRRGGSMRSTFS